MADAIARLRGLHANVCPRQVLGVRMGQYAGDLLGLDLPRTDRRLLAVVETDGCFADGVAAATGCLLGRRTLRLVDHGKVAATFVDVATERAVRLHPRHDARVAAAIYAPTAPDRWHAQRDGYAAMPTAALLVAEAAVLTVPVAQILSSPGLRVPCDACGEEIINGREVALGDHRVCLACAGEPYVELLGAPVASAASHTPTLPLPPRVTRAGGQARSAPSGAVHPPRDACRTSWPR